RTSAGWGGRPERWKVCRARSVKAPQSARRGTWTGPRLSRSTRVVLRARRRLTPVRSRGLAALGGLADLEAVTIAVGARRQGRPLAVTAEVPRFEALA